MSYYINRGLTGHKADNWLVQPGPVVYKTKWDLFATVMTWLSFIVCGAMATLFAAMILQGMG